MCEIQAVAGRLGLEGRRRRGRRLLRRRSPRQGREGRRARGPIWGHRWRRLHPKPLELRRRKGAPPRVLEELLLDDLCAAQSHRSKQKQTKSLERRRTRIWRHATWQSAKGPARARFILRPWGWATAGLGLGARTHLMLGEELPRRQRQRPLEFSHAHQCTLASRGDGSRHCCRRSCRHTLHLLTLCEARQL